MRRLDVQHLIRKLWACDVMARCLEDVRSRLVLAASGGVIGVFEVVLVDATSVVHGRI